MHSDIERILSELEKMNNPLRCRERGGIKD